MRRFCGAHARRPHEDVETRETNKEFAFDFEGVEFSDGTVIIKWYKPSPSQPTRESFPNFTSFQEEYGHSQYGIVTYWVDPEPDSVCP